MNWKLLPWPSLKTRVTFFTLAVFLTGIWSLAFYASRILIEDMERLLGEQQFSTVSVIAAEVNQELDQRLRALESVAGDIGPALLGNTAALQTYLEQRTVFQSLFNGAIYATGLDGTATAFIPLSAGQAGVNYLDRDYVARALKEGKATIGRPVIGRQLHSPIFGMAMPIRDAEGGVIGALIGVTDLGKPNFLDRITERRYGKTGDYLLVAPQHRLVITASDKSRVMEVLPAPGIIPPIDRFMQGYDGTSLYLNPRGAEVLASSKGIPAAGWNMAAILPTAEAFAPIRAMQRRVLIAATFFTLLAGALAWWMTWWMLRRQLAPMLAATRTLATLSDTNQPPQPLPVTSRDEIGELIGGFNHLLQTLGKREQALSQSESRSRAIIESSPVPLAVNDESGNITFLNHAFVQAVGYTVNDIPTLADWWPRAYPDPQYRQWVADNWQKNLEEAERTGRPFAPMELDIRCKDDSVRTFMASAAAMGQTFAGPHLVILYDITERRQSEEALRKSKQQYDAVVSRIPVGIYVLRSNPDGAFALDYASPRMAEMLGLSVESLLADSQSVFRTIHPDDRQGFIKLNQEGIQQQRPFDWTGRFPVGETVRWLHFSSSPELQKNGDVLWFGLVVDVTERKQMEDQVRQLAFYDALTRLPNRRLLSDRLSQAMAASNRSGCYGALMFIDLDNFKLLNDAHGHAVGDLLLIEAAERMKSCVREMDTVARFGGDEFVVMISELDADKSESATQAGNVAEKIRAALARPYVLKIQHEGEAATTVEHQCTASIGVALFGKHETGQDDILKRADTAMYRAKEAGCNLIRFSDSKG